MAKITKAGMTKKTDGEAKARRAPERRRTATKKISAGVAAGAAEAARPAAKGPTGEEIAKLAYKLYLERGGVNGYHLEDWYEAERILKAKG